MVQWKQTNSEKKILQTVTLMDSLTQECEKIECLLDTGADLTVVSPLWIRRHNVTMEPWLGPRLHMANGTHAEIYGTADIDVFNERGKAAGTAIVMDLNEHELLLGNNSIRQFGKLEIVYTNDSHSVTIGEELPIEASRE